MKMLSQSVTVARKLLIVKPKKGKMQTDRKYTAKFITLKEKDRKVGKECSAMLPPRG